MTLPLTDALVSILFIGVWIKFWTWLTDVVWIVFGPLIIDLSLRATEGEHRD
jgi:hypothetical protein